MCGAEAAMRRHPRGRVSFLVETSSASGRGEKERRSAKGAPAAYLAAAFSCFGLLAPVGGSSTRRRASYAAFLAASATRRPAPLRALGPRRRRQAPSRSDGRVAGGHDRAGQAHAGVVPAGHHDLGRRRRRLPARRRLPQLTRGRRRHRACAPVRTGLAAHLRPHCRLRSRLPLEAGHKVVEALHHVVEHGSRLRRRCRRRRRRSGRRDQALARVVPRRDRRGWRLPARRRRPQLTHGRWRHRARHPVRARGAADRHVNDGRAHDGRRRWRGRGGRGSGSGS
mmetsp:Transcript_14387/g.38054  ORF Transcript_14387/g.38054 Transcript_14387/m.38054 type:complete len:282 (+) Transcript_14387:318-1163(+)